MLDRWGMVGVYPGLADICGFYSRVFCYIEDHTVSVRVGKRKKGFY